MSEENKEKLGFGARQMRREEEKAARRARLAELSRRNDALLESKDFRDWLKDIADVGCFLAPANDGVYSDFQRGECAAFRMIVSRIVTHSTKGAAWLAEYAREKAVKLDTKEEK